MARVAPIIKAYAALAAVGGVAFLLSLFFRGACPIWLVVGLPCPACGMTRAFSAVMQLDFAGAFRMHPLWWLVPLLPPAFALGEKWRERVALVALVLIIGAYVVRMVVLFPQGEPMVVNEYAPLMRLLRFAQAG